MNRKEKDSVPAAEYCVLKKMRGTLHFLFSISFFLRGRRSIFSGRTQHRRETLRPVIPLNRQ